MGKARIQRNGLAESYRRMAKDSFSGPFMPEVTDLFPGAEVVDQSSINAWLDANFRKAVEAMGQKENHSGRTVDGSLRDFPPLDLLKAGYAVHVPTDACGDVTLEAHERAVDRIVQAGAVPMTALQVIFEL